MAISSLLHNEALTAQVDTVRERFLQRHWKKTQVYSYCKATSCVAATSMHALPCACRRLAFLRPMWQRPASSTMASLTACSLFLLENSALKFKWCGEATVSMRGISSPLQWAMERFHQIFSVLQNVTFNIWLYSAGYTTAYFTHLNKFSENNIRGRKTVCDTEVSPTCYTFNTFYSVPWWSQFGSLEDRYIRNDSNTLVDKIIHVARLM